MDQQKEAAPDHNYHTELGDGNDIRVMGDAFGHEEADDMYVGSKGAHHVRKRQATAVALS